LAQSAADLAADLLQGGLQGEPAGEASRWVHTRAVAARAGQAAGVLPIAHRPLLLAAAWLHDIGYSPLLKEAMTATAVGVSGFHPLDGARYLTVHGWPRPLAALVAHHSGAIHVAAALDALSAPHTPAASSAVGVTEQVAAYTVPVALHPVADALTWADQTTGPTGQAWTLAQRLDDMLTRHGPDSPNARAHSRRALELAAAVQRTEARRRSLLNGSH
jgi:hypothetical protein